MSRTINEIATQWVVRQDRGDLSAAERNELESWLDADPRHRGAFIRAEAAWSHLGRIRALGAKPVKAAGSRREPRPVAASQPRTQVSRRMMLGGGVAASVAFAAGGVFWRPARLYETHAGEIRRILLDDGSVVVLNGDAAIAVALSGRERRIDLRRGQAWFQVFHDADRPFVVKADRVQVRAVGTAFSVGRTGGGVDVMITEGVVAAKPARGAEVRLPAGSRAVLGVEGGVKAELIGAQALNRALAWREFQVALDGEGLAEAMARFNRYNARKLVVDGPDLATARVVGWFRLDDPEAFARAAALTLGARVILGVDEIRIVRAPGTDGKKIPTA